MSLNFPLQVCWDGGELVCCDVCPAAYHAECLGQDPSHLEAKQHWACPHHACAACGRGPAAAGGLLFRWVWTRGRERGGYGSSGGLCAVPVFRAPKEVWHRAEDLAVASEVQGFESHPGYSSACGTVSTFCFVG